jgi:hypothetical protein
MSAFPQADYRLLLRSTGVTNRRPDPPRDVRYGNGFIRFSPPRRTEGVSHYVIRIDRDNGPPDLVVAVGTSTIAIPPGDSCSVSSFSMSVQLESSRVTVPINGSSSSSGVAVVVSITLAAGAVAQDISVTVGSAGQLLALQIINNAVGNGVAEAGDSFEEGTLLDITDYADSVNRFLFISQGGVWCLWASPRLGS